MAQINCVYVHKASALIRLANCVKRWQGRRRRQRQTSGAFSGGEIERVCLCVFDGSRFATERRRLGGPSCSCGRRVLVSERLTGRLAQSGPGRVGRSSLLCNAGGVGPQSDGSPQLAGGAQRRRPPPGAHNARNCGERAGPPAERAAPSPPRQWLPPPPPVASRLPKLASERVKCALQ